MFVHTAMVLPRACTCVSLCLFSLSLSLHVQTLATCAYIYIYIYIYIYTNCMHVYLGPKFHMFIWSLGFRLTRTWTFG